MLSIPSKVTKRVNMLPQPTDESCGPTCLQAVYNYFDDTVDLNALINEIDVVSGGGTLAVMLGNHALKRGYKATIYTYNLNVFDPSWFAKEENLIDKLQEQMRYKESKKLLRASMAYIEFLSLNGKIEFEDLNISLIRKILEKDVPILTGLSATYLYNCDRERADNKPDDIKGYPVGHFVVISGYDHVKQHVIIADPFITNPIKTDHLHYQVELQRVLNSILLGIVTYDANLLVIEPKQS